jgi:hypothetical protein
MNRRTRHALGAACQGWQYYQETEHGSGQESQEKGRPLFSHALNMFTIVQKVNSFS